MPKELPDLLTPVTPEDLLCGFWQAWLNFFGTVPTRESIWVLVAHVRRECGLKYVHNYNLGNIKSKDGDGYDYQFFPCGEELTESEAVRAAAADSRVVLLRKYAKDTAEGTKQMASVKVLPKHPWCRFRAFETLQEGLQDHILTIYRRFGAAWPAVLAGDPRGYSHALKVQKYYTEDEAKYTQGLVRCFVDASRIQVDYSQLPTLSQKDKDTILTHVSESLAELADEEVKSDRG